MLMPRQRLESMRNTRIYGERPSLSSALSFEHQNRIEMEEGAASS